MCSTTPPNIDPYELNNAWLRFRALEVARQYETYPWQVILGARILLYCTHRVVADPLTVIGTGVSIASHNCVESVGAPGYIFLKLGHDGYPNAVWFSHDGGAATPPREAGFGMVGDLGIDPFTE